MTTPAEWPLWEIFIRGRHGLSHRHVGSLHAPDAELALKAARDVYTRRNEGVSLWAVPSAAIAARSRSRLGISWRQGAHQVAQRFTTLSRAPPARAARVRGAPASVSKPASGVPRAAAWIASLRMSPARASRSAVTAASDRSCAAAGLAAICGAP